MLASALPRPAPALRTTISPQLQRAAVLALGGLYGGVVALAPATGEILAVAGIGLDGLQPPGSTFKIITLSGVLAAGIASPHSTFAYATHATLDGVELSNAGGEECGGSLELAFATSCNSVFAPLGVKLGAARLVETAERFGFNADPGIAGAAESTIPAAGQIHLASANVEVRLVVPAVHRRDVEFVAQSQVERQLSRYLDIVLQEEERLRDAVGGKAATGILDGSTHSLTRLLHGSVGKSDDLKTG